MPVPKTKQPTEIIDINKRRERAKRKGSRAMSPAPTVRPELLDVPAVIVRTKSGKAAGIMNVPMRDIGADLILILISLHPDSCLRTTDDDYVRLGDIAMVVDPERGEIEVENARNAARATWPFRPIQVQLGVRNDNLVGLMNIPDSPEGWTLFHYILREFRHDRHGQPSGYTLFTTDHGYIPVHEFAEANLPRHRDPRDA